jgi:outer membrane protein OmpA-like peptidoglycan-associated protein
LAKVDKPQAAKEITVEGKVTEIIYGIEGSEISIIEMKRNFELALNGADFTIVWNCRGSECNRTYSIQKQYKEFGAFEAVSDYAHLKTDKSRFAVSNFKKEDLAFMVATGKKDNKKYTVGIYMGIHRLGWKEFRNKSFIQVKIVEEDIMETGQVTAASIDEKIKNEGKEVFHNILFDFGSDNLTTDSYTIIETLAAYLNTNKDRKYYIVGHTDNVGSLASNQILSEKRAKAVLLALTSKYKVSAVQISAHGVGQLSPLAINTSEEGRSLNRRVEVVLQ